MIGQSYRADQFASTHSRIESAMTRRCDARVWVFDQSVGQLAHLPGAP